MTSNGACHWTSSPAGARLTGTMLAPGEFRRQISVELNAAYGDGLLSEQTHAHRMDQVLTGRLLDPERLIGDLSLRASRRSLRNTVGRGVESERSESRELRM